jgi:Uma2 family endonuclease
MSVATTIAGWEAPGSKRHAGEWRWLIEEIGWDDCQELGKLLPSAFRLAFDGSRLEIMVTTQLHDHYADVMDTFFKAVAGALRIRFLPYRTASWTRPEIQRSIQADNCYYLTQAKIDAGLAGTARKSKDAGDYPNPDLAIEVNLSPPKVDREGIYAALKVAELWTFNGTKLTISRLGKNGRYRAVEQSGFLPIRAPDILRWIIEEDQSDYELWTQRIRAWAKTSLKAGKAGPTRRGSQ